MAIPGEPPDEEDANAASPVALSAASTMTADSLATLAAGAADTAAGTSGEITPLTISVAGTAEVSEGQEDVAGAAVFHPYATNALHDLDSEEDASGDQQVLAPSENFDTGAQQPSGEPRESPVEEASAAVVPTPVTAFLDLNRIRDEASGIIRRRNSTIGLMPSSLSSSAPENSESSSVEEGAIGGVTKRNCCKALEGNVSKHQLSPGTSADMSSMMCSICYERYIDSACCPCGHMGCYPCIQQWLSLSKPRNSCHICRQNVQTVLTPIELCDFSRKPCFSNCR